MPILNLFSKRMKTERGKLLDDYQYIDLILILKLEYFIL